MPNLNSAAHRKQYSLKQLKKTVLGKKQDRSDAFWYISSVVRNKVYYLAKVDTDPSVIWWTQNKKDAVFFRASERVVNFVEKYVQRDNIIILHGR